MDRRPVESESVAEVGYDEGARVLEIRFRTGAVYQYLDVPRACYDELMSAESIGRFVNGVIKPAFRYVRVG